MKKQYNNNINKELFSINFQEDFSEAEVERLSKIARELINGFGEQIVFNNWFEYLKESINDKYSAWNFMVAFYNFDGHNFKIKDPYPFLGLLFNKLNLSLNKEPSSDEEESIFDTFDSIYASLLTKSGIVTKDDYFYINLYSDNLFQIAVKENK